MGPAEYYKKIAAVPDGPWVVKLTNSPAATNKFHRAFSRSWFVIGLKGLFHPAISPYPRGSPTSDEIDINPTDFEFL